MARRSTRRSVLDDRGFPVRVAFACTDAERHIRWTDAQVWLREHLGAGNFACHGLPNHCPYAMAFYFLTVADAARFVAAHPDYRFADGPGMVAHLREARDYAASGMGPGRASSV